MAHRPPSPSEPSSSSSSGYRNPRRPPAQDEPDDGISSSDLGLGRWNHRPTHEEPDDGVDSTTKPTEGGNDDADRWLAGPSPPQQLLQGEEEREDSSDSEEEEDEILNAAFNQVDELQGFLEDALPNGMPNPFPVPVRRQQQQQHAPVQPRQQMPAQQRPIIQPQQRQIQMPVQQRPALVQQRQMSVPVQRPAQVQQRPVLVPAPIQRPLLVQQRPALGQQRPVLMPAPVQRPVIPVQQRPVLVPAPVQRPITPVQRPVLPQQQQQQLLEQQRLFQQREVENPLPILRVLPPQQQPHSLLLQQAVQAPPPQQYQGLPRGIAQQLRQQQPVMPLLPLQPIAMHPPPVQVHAPQPGPSSGQHRAPPQPVVSSQSSMAKARASNEAVIVKQQQPVLPEESLQSLFLLADGVRVSQSEGSSEARANVRIPPPVRHNQPALRQALLPPPQAFLPEPSAPSTSPPVTTQVPDEGISASGLIDHGQVRLVPNAPDDDRYNRLHPPSKVMRMVPPSSVYDDPAPGPSRAPTPPVASVVNTPPVVEKSEAVEEIAPEVEVEEEEEELLPSLVRVDDDDDDDDDEVQVEAQNDSFPTLNSEGSFAVDDLEDIQLQNLLSEPDDLDLGCLKAPSPPPVTTHSSSSCFTSGPLTKRLLRRVQQETESSSSSLSLNLCSIIRDAPVQTRARASLPASHLLLDELSGRVIAKNPLQPGSRFGPAEGTWHRRATFASLPVLNEDMLLSFGRGKESVPTADVLDMSDESKSNWMRFVRLDEANPNLELRQDAGGLFFVVTAAIGIGDELRLGFSKDYLARRARFFSSSSSSSSKVIKTLMPSRPDSLCRACGLDFPNPILCSLHQVRHGDGASNTLPTAGSLEVACPDCSELFPSLGELSDHVTKTHSCGKGSVADVDHEEEDEEDDDDVMEVDGQQTKKKTHKCQMCYKGFSSLERLQRHALVHSRDESKPLGCTDCGRRFINISALSCHQKIHEGEKTYECPICSTRFAQIVLLKEHVHSHRSEETGKYTCPSCYKTFKEYSAIRKHIRAFHGAKKFNCDECGKAFSTSSKLGLHSTVHSDQKSFQCSSCGKFFGRKDKLKEHFQRMHRNNLKKEPQVAQAPPAVAVVIPAATVEPEAKVIVPAAPPSSPSSADYQMYIYKCHECKMGFKRRGMLVNHLAKRHPHIPPASVPELNLPILKAAKDFNCHLCQKVYKSSSKRKAHVLKKHPGRAPPLPVKVVPDGGQAQQAFSTTVGSIALNPHGCNACHKQFASRAKLLQHERKSHPPPIKI